MKKDALNAAQVDAIEKPGLYAVGGCVGLCLQISPTFTRSWILRFRKNGKCHEMGLGSCDDVTLEEARTRATRHRDELKNGFDPIESRENRRREKSLKAIFDFELAKAVGSFERNLRFILDGFGSLDEQVEGLKLINASSPLENRMKHRETLSGEYVRSVLVDAGFPKDHITPGLVALKREHLRISRLLTRKK